HRFRFPRAGGTGAIWTAVSRLIPAARLRFDARVTALDVQRRRARLADGQTLPYDHLISSVPLDALCQLAEGLDPAVSGAAGALRHSAVHVVGVALRGDRPASLGGKCWIYFPEPNSPYYRVTVFSHYSPGNVPAGEGYWSLMAEVCETPGRPVEAAGLRAATLAAMERDGLVGPRS